MDSSVVRGYRETPAAPALAEDVHCLWTRDVAAGPAPAVHRVLPDGCIDLIWGLNGAVHVAGPDTGPVLATLPPGARISGLRFRPGRAARFLGVPASELVDARVSLDDLWGEEAARLSERLALAEAPSGAGVPAVLQAAVQDRLSAAAAPDRLVGAVVHRLAAGHLPVAALASDLGVSERHL